MILDVSLEMLLKLLCLLGDVLAGPGQMGPAKFLVFRLLKCSDETLMTGNGEVMMVLFIIMMMLGGLLGRGMGSRSGGRPGSRVGNEREFRLKFQVKSCRYVEVGCDPMAYWSCSA